jgi:hypothetical protein
MIEEFNNQYKFENPIETIAVGEKTWQVGKKIFYETIYTTELKFVRDFIFKKSTLNDDDVKLISEQYLNWVKKNDYLVFKSKQIPNYFKLCLMAKRGNKVYAKRCYKKLKKIKESLNVDEFKELLLRQDGRKFYSNVLFITLTCDANLWDKNRFLHWKDIQKYYNKFITNFRKVFKCKAFVIKAIESTLNAEPHLHLLVITNRAFEAFNHKGIWRIKEKRKLEKYWHSFVDIRVPVDFKDVFNYLVKDMLKQFTNIVVKAELDEKSQKIFYSLALNWLFKKKALTISGKTTINSILELADLIYLSITQTFNNEIITEQELQGWEVIGFTRCTNDFSGTPPPTEIYLLFNNELDTAFLLDNIRFFI